MKKYFLMILIIITFVFTNHITAKPLILKQTIKRFVFAIGANNGGSERVKLQYAQSDAKSIVRVLQKMGGVVPEDCFLLNQPDPERLRSEMANLNNKVKKANTEHSRVEVIFYYSGHSDKEALFLKNDKVTYKEYRELINDINSNVKITILDSCASGTFTRFKGVKPRPPFLLDKANNMEGFAIITSCSSEETSQESDYLKGSFFTHNFIVQV